MARVSLRITNVHTVNVEFWEEHAGSLKRSRGKSCLLKRTQRQLCEWYLASDSALMVQEIKAQVSEVTWPWNESPPPTKWDKILVIYYLSSSSTTTCRSHWIYLSVKILKVWSNLLMENRKLPKFWHQLWNGNNQTKPNQKVLILDNLQLKKRKMKETLPSVYQLMNNLWSRWKYERNDLGNTPA